MPRALLLVLLLGLCSSSSDASSGINPRNTMQPLKGLNKPTTFIEHGSSSSSRSLQQEDSSSISSTSTATCPGGIKAIWGCVGTPPPRFTCEVVDCMPDKTCAMYTCGSECVPLCVDPDIAENCPAGVPVVKCDYNPCAVTLCKVGTMCVPRRCGQCVGECRDLRPPLASPSTGPDDAAGFCIGDTDVQCLLDPCQTKNCTGNRYCASEYCGGCNAACLTRDAPCANGKARRPCMGTANRCILAKFGWGITCVPDQCDDCAARAVGPCKPGWFVNWELAACRFCPKGFACAGGSNTMVTAPPKPCNGGKFADKRGLSQCRQCPAGTTTPAVPANRGYAACVPEK